MLPVVSCYLMGGLGNQLFQIFATISYGIDTHRCVIFPFNEVLTVGATRPTYWGHFLNALLPMTTHNDNVKYTNNHLLSFYRIQEPTFAHSMLPDMHSYTEIILYGYFQSYKYFLHNQDEIFSMIGLLPQQVRIRHEFGLDYAEDVITVSMHFRIGDYQHIQHMHPVLPYDYYENAIRELKTRLDNPTFRVLYFCEAPDRDMVDSIIRRLTSRFEDVTFVNVDTAILDWKQMLMMSCCHHHIIANSTFSWWGAYMNRNPNKVVCYPFKWFGPSLANHSTVDLTPREWHKITYTV